MFHLIFGEYLVKSNCITAAQLEKVYQGQEQIRVKLGLIAVSERLMTEEQADEINKLQAIKDMRFGDIAIERGYLTEEQVDNLLSMQGNVYLTFAQTLVELEYMTLQGIESALKVFQCEHGFSSGEMESMKSGDIDRIVPLYTPFDNQEYTEICGIVIRTIQRVISQRAFPRKAILVKEVNCDRAALQVLSGDKHHSLIIAGSNHDLLAIASVFAGEEFAEVDMDALDAVGEFINCLNGIYATALSYRHIEVDMLPPEYFLNTNKVVSEELCVLPIQIGSAEIKMIYTTSNVVIA